MKHTKSILFKSIAGFLIISLNFLNLTFAAEFQPVINQLMQPVTNTENQNETQPQSENPPAAETSTDFLNQSPVSSPEDNADAPKIVNAFQVGATSFQKGLGEAGVLHPVDSQLHIAPQADASNIHLITLGSTEESRGINTDNGVKIFYDTDAPGNLPDFAGGGMTFVTPLDISGLDQWIFGFQADHSDLRFEIYDNAGGSVVMQLAEVRAEGHQAYAISVQQLRDAGIQVDQIKKLVVVVRGSGKKGSMEFFVNNYVPVPLQGVPISAASLQDPVDFLTKAEPDKAYLDPEQFVSEHSQEILNVQRDEAVGTRIVKEIYGDNFDDGVLSNLWTPERTQWEERDGRLYTVPAAIPGFNYGHSGDGRNSRLNFGIGDPNLVNYRVEFDYGTLPVNPAFNPFGLDSTLNVMYLQFRAQSLPQSWNDPAGDTAYVFSLTPTTSGDQIAGDYSLGKATGEYRGHCCSTRFPEAKQDGNRSSSIDPNVNHVALEVIDNHMRAWVNGRLVIDYTDANPIPYGGIGLQLLWEAQGWFDNFHMWQIENVPPQEGRIHQIETRTSFIDYEYNEDQTLKHVTVRPKSAGLPVQNFNFEYGFGRLRHLRVVSAGVYEFRYNDAGNVTKLFFIPESSFLH